MRLRTEFDFKLMNLEQKISEIDGLNSNDILSEKSIMS